MIYTVAIGDNLINNIGTISRVRTLDDTDDYASIILNRDTTLTTKQMKEVVTITVNDNSEFRSYYYLIDSDIATPIDKDTSTYSRHEISLIELTSRMSDYTVGYRQFTNSSDSTYDVVQDLTQTIFLKDIDGDPTRILDINLTHSSLDILKNISARDYRFDNHTYREAIGIIFNEVGGIPRIIFEDGVYKLTLELENERKTLRSIFTNAENDYKETHNITKYGTCIESYVDNQVFDKTKTGAATVEPSENGYQPLTSLTEVFDSDNTLFQTRYKIRELIKAEVFFTNVDATTVSIDMTPRIVPEDVYKGLPVGDTTNTQLGNTTDGLLSEFTTPAPTLIDGTLQVSQRIGTLFFKDNLIQNWFTIFGGTVFANWSQENWNYIVNSLYYEEYGNEPGSSAKLKYESDMKNWENIRIRVTYIPFFDSVLNAERYNTDDIDKYTMVQSNQSASSVSTEKALKQLGTRINAMGNKEVVTTARLTLLANEFEVGDYTSEGYILTKKEVLYYKDHFIVRYEWDKDYQNRNQDIALDSAMRYYAIPSGGISDRQLVYKEYVYVGFPSLTSESTLLSFRAKEIFTNIFEKSATYNTSIQNAFVTNEDVLTTTTPVLLPVISVGGRNVLNFNFGFQSPNVAGTRLDTTTQSIPILEPVEYADLDGEVENINFELVDTVTITDSKELPLQARANRGNSLVGDITKKYVVKKDSAETISLSYQLHMIPNNNIVLGDYLTTRNNLIETKTSFDDLVVYSSNTYYTPQETARVKGTATALTVNRLSNEILTISANVNNSAWAIGTSDGQLIIAVNQFTSTQDTIYFNYFNSRNDINYEFLGVYLGEIPANPSGLVVTTINSQNLKLDWIDNSTNESNFYIEISEAQITGYTFLDTTAVNVNTYSTGGLKPDTTYYFRVWATNQAGRSVGFTSGSAKTDAVPNPPLSVTNFIATQDSGTILNASWTVSANADFYDIGIKKNVQDDTFWVDSVVTDPTSIKQYTGLDPETFYDLRIKARNVEGSSGYKYYYVATGSLPLPDPTDNPSFDPLDITVTESSISFTVTNNDASNVTIVADYALGVTGDSTPDRTTQTNVVTKTSTITYSGLNAATPYTLSATAQASGESISDTIYITRITSDASTPPDAPSTFTAVIEGGGIRYGWSNVTSETGYVIEMHTNSSYSNLFKSISKSADVTTHLESPLLNGTYWARIKSVNAIGSSSWKLCNPLSITI